MDRVQADGKKASSICLRFLAPLEPGLKQIFDGFRKVMTIELNYSDDIEDPLVHRENRRYSQLARVLRDSTLVDVDCWSRVPGVPLSPGVIEDVIRKELDKLETGEDG